MSKNDFCPNGIRNQLSSVGDGLKRIIIICLLFVVTGSLTGMCHAETVMNLSGCLEYGLENSPSVKEADYAVAATEESRKSVRADFLPSLSSSYSFSRIENISSTGSSDSDYLNQYIRNFSVTLSQVLYAGNRVINNYRKAKLDLEREQADQRLVRLELSYNIQATFFQLMGSKLDVRVAKGSVKRLKEGVESARAYLEKSLISYAQVLSAEVDLADARQQLSQAMNNVNRKRVALFSLMNHTVSGDVTFGGGLEFFGDDYPSGFENCWAVAGANRPDLESLAKQVGMKERDAAVSLGSYLPMVKMNLGYNDMNRDYDTITIEDSSYDRDQRNRYWSAGVTASWDLFDGGRNWYNRTSILMQAQQVREQIKKTRLSIKEGIRKALFSIAEARLRTKSTQVAVEAAKEGFNVEKYRLAAGLATFSNLLDAQLRLTRAESNYTQAMLDYQLGRAELKFMMGEPEE